MGRADNLTTLHVPIVLKSGSLIFLEPSAPVEACNGIALPLHLNNMSRRFEQTEGNVVPVHAMKACGGVEA